MIWCQQRHWTKDCRDLRCRSRSIGACDVRTGTDVTNGTGNKAQGRVACPKGREGYPNLSSYLTPLQLLAEGIFFFSLFNLQPIKVYSFLQKIFFSTLELPLFFSKSRYKTLVLSVPFCLFVGLLFHPNIFVYTYVHIIYQPLSCRD